MLLPANANYQRRAGLSDKQKTREACYTLQDFAAREGIDQAKLVASFKKSGKPKPVTDLQSKDRRKIYKLSELLSWKVKECLK